MILLLAVAEIFVSNLAYFCWEEYSEYLSNSRHILSTLYHYLSMSAFKISLLHLGSICIGLTLSVRLSQLFTQLDKHLPHCSQSKLFGDTKLVLWWDGIWGFMLSRSLYGILLAVGNYVELSSAYLNLLIDIRLLMYLSSPCGSALSGSFCREPP